VQAALDALTRRVRIEFAELHATVGYAPLSAVQHLLPSHEGTVIAEPYAEAVSLHLRVPQQQLAALRTAIGNATHRQAVLDERDA